MGIESVIHSINSAYRAWGEHLGNPNFCRQGNSLTWQSRQKVWLRNEFDTNAYRELSRLRQYSFVVADDGGLIQLFYQFSGDGETLIAASVSYYGPGQITLLEEELASTDFAVEEEEVEAAAASEATAQIASDTEAREPDLSEAGFALELHIESGTEEFIAGVVPIDEDAVYGIGQDHRVAEIVEMVPSIRIDYAPKAKRPFVHEPVHLHIPGFSAARIPVSGFPSPEQFIELVFAWFYPKVYEEHFKRHTEATFKAETPEDSVDEAKAFRLERVRMQRERWFPCQILDLPRALPWLQFSHKEA